MVDWLEIKMWKERERASSGSGGMNGAVELHVYLSTSQAEQKLQHTTMALSEQSR
jgi:hypothetical protein